MKKKRKNQIKKTGSENAKKSPEIDIPKIDIPVSDPVLSRASSVAVEEEALSISGKKPTVSFSWKNPLFMTLAVIITLFLIGFILIFKMYLNAQNKLTKLQTNLSVQPTPNQQEIKRLVAVLDKHIVLPIEEPKIIYLSNVETLKQEQKFFSSAVDGDILFIYSQKVILYDPVKDKVKDVAQIRLNPPTDTPTPTSVTISPSETPAKSPAATQSAGKE